MYKVRRQEAQERKERLERRVLAKMQERKIKDLSPKEIDRVFQGVCSPTACKRIVAWMLSEGLTIEDVYKD